MLIDAITHRRVDVLPDREAATLPPGCVAIPGVEVVCRDGSAAYAEAIRQAAPKAVQASDRWHLWHVRREALIDRVEVRDLRRCPVAAGW
ncbi:MAG: transposase [Labedaea sp.]